MMDELKPCPFCGWEFAEHAWNEFGEEYRVCDQCGASSGTVDSKWDWQSRPIEDALNARIAELEAAQRWIPVCERLPEDRLTLEFDAVISYTTDDPYVSVVFRDYNKSRWLEDKGGERLTDVTNYVTHWRERPTLPEVQE